MIINFIINFILLALGFIFTAGGLLPPVDIASIPFIGEFLSSTLITVVQVWNAFVDSFPYAGVAWNIFIWVVLPFEVILLVAKFILGHRVPTNDTK